MLKSGVKGYASETVTERLTAKSFGSGELPVYATPAVIALIEKAAWTSIADMLEEGQGTVGTKLEVSHVSATPVGLKVWCETELTKIDGRRLVFSVKAYDEAGLIAEGTHERFLVFNERFLQKAEGKSSEGRTESSRGFAPAGEQGKATAAEKVVEKMCGILGIDKELENGIVASSPEETTSLNVVEKSIRVGKSVKESVAPIAEKAVEPAKKAGKKVKAAAVPVVEKVKETVEKRGKNHL